MTPEESRQAIAEWDAAREAVWSAGEELGEAELTGSPSEIHDAEIELTLAKERLRRIEAQFPEERFWDSGWCSRA
jgi:hypothetical protein